MIGEFIHAHKFLIGLLAGGFVSILVGWVSLFIAYELAIRKVEHDNKRNDS